LELNYEEINFRNMIDFYRDELLQVIEGKRAIEVFGKNYASKLSKNKILKIIVLNPGGKRHILTDKAKEILDSRR